MHVPEGPALVRDRPLGRPSSEVGWAVSHGGDGAQRRLATRAHRPFVDRRRGHRLLYAGARLLDAATRLALLALDLPFLRGPMARLLAFINRKLHA